MRLVPYLNALVGAVIAGAISTAFLIPALPFAALPRGRRERYIWWTNTGASYGILRYALWAKLDVEGRDQIPFGQPYMVVANHRSWVDVITLIWAARAEGLGMGWVSIFDPGRLAELLGMPDGADPIAVLCLGPVPEFPDRPVLELDNWAFARPLSEFVAENTWPDG